MAIWNRTPSPPAAIRTDPDRSAKMDEYVASQIGEEDPGLALTIVKSGAIVHAAGYGLSDWRRNVPITQDTIFHLASTGKQFTGNIIPTDRISGVSQQILAIYQKSYAPQSGGIDNNSRGILQGTPSQTPNTAVIKLDHILRADDHLSGSWVYDHRPRTLLDSAGLWQAGRRIPQSGKLTKLQERTIPTGHENRGGHTQRSK